MKHACMLTTHDLRAAARQLVLATQLASIAQCCHHRSSLSTLIRGALQWIRTVGQKLDVYCPPKLLALAHQVFRSTLAPASNFISSCERGHHGDSRGRPCLRARWPSAGGHRLCKLFLHVWIPVPPGTLSSALLQSILRHSTDCAGAALTHVGHLTLLLLG
jgi:hypothetical protein